MSGSFRFKHEQAFLPTKYGEFTLHIYNDESIKEEIIVLQRKEIKKRNLLVRIHSECFTGDVLSSIRCDCQEQLQKSMEMIGKSDSGLIFYLHQEGRGIGLLNKIRAYKLQDEGEDTVSANVKLDLPIDDRSYASVGEILQSMNIESICLLTNNPQKVGDIQKCGIEVKRIALKCKSNCFNEKYLNAKTEIMNHW